MGMFDKDKLYGGLRLDEKFNIGDKFVLFNVMVMDARVPTAVGDAEKTLLVVSYIEGKDKISEAFIVGTLASAIADKAKEAAPDDFPAIVELAKVPSSYQGKDGKGQDATVIQFVSPYSGKVPNSLPDFDAYMNQDPVTVPDDNPL